MAKSLNSYQSVERYLNSFTLYSSLRLDRIKKLLSILENPQNKFASILVGGTAGKGSTATMTASILQESGLKVGLFTSPHLVKLNERFVINGKQISDKRLIKLTNGIRHVILIPHFAGEGPPSKSSHEGDSSADVRRLQNDGITNLPSYFELLTALAFLWFAEQKIDVAVLEVGMGGRFDATNVVKNKISVLTNVYLDHTQYLGKTVEAIAKEKVAILKEKGILITGVSQSSVIKLIKNFVRSRKARVFWVNDGYYRLKEINRQETLFDLKTPNKGYKNLSLKLLGEHQIINAALAVKAVEEFCRLKLLPHSARHTAPGRIRCRLVPGNDEKLETAIRQGLKKAFIPGRLEIISAAKERSRIVRFSRSWIGGIGGAKIILDGAHNPIKMQTLVKTLKTLWPKEKFTTLLAIKKDKDVKKMLKSILPITQELIVTEFKSKTDFGPHMSTKATKLAALAKKIAPFKEIHIEADSQKALQKALRIVNKNQLILITGSLYLVGELYNN